MSKSDGYVFSNQTLFVMSNGRTATVKRSEVHFDAVSSAVESGNFAEAFAAIDKAEAIRKQSKGGFQVSNGVVLRNGVPVHNVVTNRILEFMTSKLPFTPLFSFLEKLNENPSARAVNELYAFLEYRNLFITPDGDFLAYKSVGSDWLSKTSGREDVEVSEDGGKTFKIFKGRIPNKVGNIVRIKRNLVDDNRNNECSYGLHVGALEYAGPGGTFNSASDHVVVVRVNPRDAVSVPRDHSAQKLRVCEYEVVAEFGQLSTQKEVVENEKATPFKNGEIVSFRCRSCRKRKKASTFRGVKGKRERCPRCKSKNTFRL